MMTKVNPAAPEPILLASQPSFLAWYIGQLPNFPDPG